MFIPWDFQWPQTCPVDVVDFSLSAASATRARLCAVLQVGGSVQMPSPWRRDMAALQTDLYKVQHEDEDQGAAITQSLDRLMRMRSQAQSSVAAGASASPGAAFGYASGSDAENSPAENAPEQCSMDADDTVRYGDSRCEQGAAVVHEHLAETEVDGAFSDDTAVHGVGAAVGEVALAMPGAILLPVCCYTRAYIIFLHTGCESGT